MIPPAAACDELSDQMYDAGSLAATTWVYTACRIVLLFVSVRTSVHPLGGVIVGAPRTEIAITSTSPARAPVGAGMDSVFAVGFELKLEPRSVIAVVLVAACVVTCGLASLRIDVLPDASNASTV